MKSRLESVRKKNTDGRASIRHDNEANTVKMINVLDKDDSKLNSINKVESLERQLKDVQLALETLKGKIKL